MKKQPYLLALILCLFSMSAFSQGYTENNHAKVSFDVSMPIDSSGYILHGQNLTGGVIHFSDTGNQITPFLSKEIGQFQLPIVYSTDDSPLIKTNIRYQAIKFINPTGIDNIFIKVGAATRTQVVAGLGPSVLKNGTYTWQVPFFAIGKESDTVENKSHNLQFMQVGSVGGPASKNVMYTQDFYLHSQGEGDTTITGHPIKTARLNEALPAMRHEQFNCKASGLWGAGGADPYRTITGKCAGNAIVYPAGPNLDYEYGQFTLPTVHTPWTATPSDHCILKGKKQAGCTNAIIGIKLHYMAQKIRVPINKNLDVFAEYGHVFRRITATNLRYVCKSNVYLKNILPAADCLKKSYLSGSSQYPFFAVGFKFTKNGQHYSARYINIPGQENGNRLAWLDASVTQIYAISTPNNESTKQLAADFNNALNEIKTNTALYDVLGKRFFSQALKINQSHLKTLKQ